MSETPRHYRKPLSFVRRSNRLKPSYQRAWDAALGQELLDIPAGERDTAVAEGFSIDWEAEFARFRAADSISGEFVVEIGSGSGEAIAHAAAQNPAVNFLAIEVYKPGAAQLAARIRREGLANVRVACMDAVEILDKLIPAGALNQLWIFFPDPWHKKKHHKRRLIQPGFVDKAARVLEPGGQWRLATDWSNYAEQMREVIGASELFTNPHAGQRAGAQSALTRVRREDLDALSLGKEPQPMPEAEAIDHQGGWAPRFHSRVQTDFEAKALNVGRQIFDLTYLRTS